MCVGKIKAPQEIVTCARCDEVVQLIPQEQFPSAKKIQEVHEKCYQKRKMGTGSLDYNNKLYGYISVLYLIFPYFDIFKLIKQLIKNIPKIFWQSKRNIHSFYVIN